MRSQADMNFLPHTVLVIRMVRSASVSFCLHIADCIKRIMSLTSKNVPLQSLSTGQFFDVLHLLSLTGLPTPNHTLGECHSLYYSLSLY